ncbi:MAG: hypothetical protein JW981_04300 [Anaerolineae bacterium]|nr:hypothetical protein [Anaerolineae bacterium]
MNTYDPYFDEFESYETSLGSLKAERRERRRFKAKNGRDADHSDALVLSELGGATFEVEGNINTTYRPSRYEAEWLLSSLQPFFEQMLITDVVARLKGGKDASVYCCAADPSTGEEFLAAKVYRPQKFRGLSNDALYRDGRDILTSSGQPVLPNDDRVIRAIGKKTTFGRQVMRTSWLMYEFMTMKRLHLAGGAVPKPVASSDNAILMQYFGDIVMAAPTLNAVDLDPDDARRLFPDLLGNIELMLRHGFVHGDLSPYNILYWEGELVIIDFPQAVDIYGNNQAYAILKRDIERLCDYFKRQGVSLDPGAVLDDLWRRYGSEADDYRLEMSII